MSSWTTDESDGLARCGHCDNCTRDRDSLDERDVTYQTWQILKIVEETERSNGNITLSMLANVARGVGTVTSGKGKAKEKTSLDLDQLCGGKVDLKREVRFSPCLCALLTLFSRKSSVSSFIYCLRAILQKSITRTPTRQSRT